MSKIETLLKRLLENGFIGFDSGDFKTKSGNPAIRFSDLNSIQICNLLDFCRFYKVSVLIQEQYVYCFYEE